MNVITLVYDADSEKIRSVKMNALYVFMLLLAIFVLSVTSTSAQNALDLDATLTSMSASSDPAVINEATHINDLAYDVQPIVFINNNVESDYGPGVPVCATVDAPSVSALSSANPLFSSVELITIKLNSPDDLNFNLDLSALSSFSNLKYVLLLCSFDCQPSLLDALYSNNPDSGIKVFYSISIPK